MAGFHAPRGVVKAAQDGDEKATANLFNTLHPEVIAYLKSKGLQEADAEDVAGTVWVHFARHLGSFDLERDFAPWFQNIVSNLCRNHFRDQKRKSRVLSLEVDCTVEDFSPMDVAPSPDLDPLRRLELLEDLAEVEKKLAQVPVRWRVGLTLHVSGHSHQEAGKRLGVTAASAKRNLVNLRKYLRDR